MTVVYFDVDDTLIVWKGSPTLKYEECKAFMNIHGIDYGVHTAMVNMLKHQADMGNEVIIWSAGGEKWAKMVANALGITKYCKHILCKPNFYYDDNKNPLCHSSRMYLDLEGNLIL